MTLLKRLKEGKDEIEEHIRSHLPPHGSLPDAPVLRDTDFYKKFVALAADWEVQQLQLKRGLLGPPLADEPEVIETVFGNVNGESDLNTALSVYAERKEHRKTLGPRIVRQLKARNKQLMKLAGMTGASYGRRNDADPVLGALRDLVITEDVIVKRGGRRSPDIKAFIAAVYSQRSKL
jgi:hypothetical protein